MGQLKIFVVLEKGIVVNRTQAETALADNWIENAEAQIGWVWDGAAFSPPAPLPKTVDELKAEREAAVAAIKITTAAGRVFDGDEKSQSRMARALLGLQKAAASLPPGAAAPTVDWVLADNSSAAVGLAELSEALLLSGQAQTALWKIHPEQ